MSKKREAFETRCPTAARSPTSPHLKVSFRCRRPRRLTTVNRRWSSLDSVSLTIQQFPPAQTILAESSKFHKYAKSQLSDKCWRCIANKRSTFPSRPEHAMSVGQHDEATIWLEGYGWRRICPSGEP